MAKWKECTGQLKKNVSGGVQAHKEDLSYGRYWLSRYLAWYNTKRRHGGYGMKGRTPQQRIEDWILTNKSYSTLPDVNETLILYIY